MCYQAIEVNSLWPSDNLWWQRSGSTLAQVRVWCLTLLISGKWCTCVIKYALLPHFKFLYSEAIAFSFPRYLVEGTNFLHILCKCPYIKYNRIYIRFKDTCDTMPYTCYYNTSTTNHIPAPHLNSPCPVNTIIRSCSLAQIKSGSAKQNSHNQRLVDWYDICVWLCTITVYHLLKKIYKCLWKIYKVSIFTSVAIIWI